MRLSNSVPVNPTAQNFWSTVGRIKDELYWDQADLAHCFNVSPRSLERLQSYKREPDLEKVTHFCDRLHLDLEKLMYGTLNFEAMKRQYFGELDYVPQRYRVSANVDLADSLKALNYIRKKYDKKLIHVLLCHLQIREEAFEKNPLVNLRVMVDILSFLKKANYQSVDYCKMGKALIREIHQSDSIYSLTKNQKDILSFFEKFIELTPVKSSWHYKVRKNDSKSWSLLTFPKKETVSLIGEPSFFRSDFCSYRRGLFTQLPKSYGYRAQRVKKLSCILQGDSFCRYNFSSF